MVSRSWVVLVFAWLALSAPAGAQTPPAKPAAPKSTPEVAVGTKKVDIPQGETTEVKGKIPVDLVGLWLVVEEHQLPAGSGKVYTVLQLYRVDKSEKGELEIHWFTFRPPEAVQAKLAKAQSEQKSWSPDQADVAAINAALAASPPRVDEKLRGQHYVVETAKLDADSKKSPASKDAIFAIRSIFQLHDRPLFGQSYFVAKATKDELSGKMTMGAVPSNRLGIPLPIGTTGTFRWMRLVLPPASVPSPGSTPDGPTPTAAPTPPSA